MRTVRLAGLAIAAACCALLLPSLAEIGDGAAASTSGCSTSSESRQPVLLVHGFNSDAGTWDKSRETFANSATCVATFDYGSNSTDWVTNPAIGARLGTTIHQLASASRSGGGTGKVIVVAHSMGGLATRCAVSSGCGGGSSSDLRELITFGTPNHGTFLKSYGLSNLADLVGPYLSYSGGCYGNDDAKIPGLCKEIQALGTSAAGKAFTPGSAELDALPALPSSVPDFAVAGSFPVTTNLFLHTFTVGDLGDLVVARESALSAARAAGGTGGQGSTVPCGSLDLITGAFAFRCWHGTETSYSGFVAQAQAEIARVEKEDRPDPVLGASWGPYQEGFGTARPKTVFNGGDPTGLLKNITWSSWGASTAIGSATGNYEGPNESVAASRPEPAMVEAFDLGSCKGKTAYRRLVWWYPQHGEAFDPSPYKDSEGLYNICTGGQSSGTGGLASPSENATVNGCPTQDSLENALFGGGVYSAQVLRDIKCSGMWAAALYDYEGNAFPGTFEKVDGVWAYFKRDDACRRSDFPQVLRYICTGS